MPREQPDPPPKIIFLDIDGVLNDFEGDRLLTGESYQTQITPRCVKAFNRIIRATEARIVLSSSWRYLIINQHFSLNGFGIFLRSHGVRGELIGHTREDGASSEIDHWEPRYMQIADWLRKNGTNGYCILDDDPDAFGGRSGVQTNGAYGLSDADAELAIEILSGVKEQGSAKTTGA